MLTIIKVANKAGGSLFASLMWFLGIDPFDNVSDASALTALARALNSSWFALPKSWAQSFCKEHKEPYPVFCPTISKVEFSVVDKAFK